MESRYNLPPLKWVFDRHNSSNDDEYRWYDLRWEPQLFYSDGYNYVVAYSRAAEHDKEDIAAQLQLDRDDVNHKDYWRVLYGDRRDHEFVPKSEYPTYQRLRRKLELEVKLLDLERVTVHSLVQAGIEPRLPWEERVKEI